MCVCGVSVCVSVCMLACLWGSEANLWEVFLSFYHVGPREQIQVIRLGRKFSYPLSHLAHSVPTFIIWNKEESSFSWVYRADF